MAVLWPVVLYFHGLYQLKRGRSRIDELFAIVFSVLIASALTLGATLYVRVYYRYQPEVAPRWEYSQAVFALFVVLDVLLLNAGRWAVRAWQERRWAAGENLTRVLVAGTGELGRTVAEALLGQRRARLPGGGLPRRGTRRRGPRRPARPGHDRRGPRGHRAQPGRPALRRPAPRGPRPARPPRQGPQQRVRRHQGGARRRAVRDHQGRARGPRRDPDHQPQRGAAPGLEQHGEAADGRRAVSSLLLLGLTVVPVLPAPRPARSPLRRQGPGPASPGAHDPRREDLPDLQVPHHGATRPRRRRARSSRPRTTRAARRSGPGSGATTSTSCRSS